MDSSVGRAAGSNLLGPSAERKETSSGDDAVVGSVTIVGDGVQPKPHTIRGSTSSQHPYNLRSGGTASNDVPVRGRDRGTEEYIQVLKQALLEVASENELVYRPTHRMQLRMRVAELEAEVQQADRDLESKEQAIVELEALLKVTRDVSL